MADLSIEPMPGTQPVKEKPEGRSYNETSDVLALYRERAALFHEYFQENVLRSYEDVQFAYFDQWPEEAKRLRKDRPMLNLNLVATFINLMVGAAQQQRHSIHVKHVGGMFDPIPIEGDSESTLSPSEIMEGIIRQIETNCNAQTAYNDAYKDSIDGGWGWLKVFLEQPVDNPFDLEIGIRHVMDRNSVMFDPHCKDADFKDANWFIESTVMGRKEFQARYPNQSVEGLPAGGEYSQDFYAWFNAKHDVVRVSDYWYREPMKRTAIRLVHTQDLTEIINYRDQIEPVLDELKEAGFVIDSQKEVQTYKIKQVRCSATEILEGPNDWPGIHFPFVPVIGRKTFIGGVRQWWSLTHWARSSQMMHNYWASAATEFVGDQPRQPWMATPDQIAGHEHLWAESSISMRKVLPYNFVEGQDKPERIKPPDLPTSYVHMAALGKQGVMDTIGLQEANLGKKSNETSGLAIQQRQEAGSLGTIEFLSNLRNSIRFVGVIICDLIPRVYNREHVRRIILPDDTQAQVRLNNHVVDQETGKPVNIGDISMSRYNCTATTGPAFATMNEEFVQMTTELMRTNPALSSLLTDLIVQATDFPYRKEITRRLIASGFIPRSVLRPEQQMSVPEPQPTPEQEVAMMEHQAKMEDAKSDLERSQLAVEIQQLKLEEAQVNLEKAIADAAASGEEGSEEDDDMNRDEIKKVVLEVLAETKEVRQ